MHEDSSKRDAFQIPAKNWATYAIVIANTLVFFAFESSITNTLTLKEKLLEFGALHPLLLWKGEIWRLVTATFLHGSFLHFAFNTFVLLQVGRLYEPLIGSGRLLFLFLITGVSGFAFSTLTNCEISLGSSGAVFGLIGAMLGTVINLPRDRFDAKLLQRLAFFVVLNLAFGIFLNQVTQNLGKIDNAAHVGGLLFGMLFGFALVTETPFFQSCPLDFRKRRQKQATGILVVSLVGFFSLVGLALKPAFLENYHEAMGFDALLSKDFESAGRHITWLEKTPKSRINGQILESRLAAAHGDTEKSRSIIMDALKSWHEDESSFWDMALLQRKSPMEIQDALFGDELGNSILCRVLANNNTKKIDVLNDCAWLFLMSRDEKVHDAKEGLDLALKAVRNQTQVPAAVLHTLAEAYLQNNRPKEALYAIDRALLTSDRVVRKALFDQRAKIEVKMLNGSTEKKT